MDASPVSVRRTGLLVVVLATLVAACAEPTPASSTEPAPVSTRASSTPEQATRPTYVRDTALPEEIIDRNTPKLSPEAEDAFFECLEGAGYTREDWSGFRSADGEIHHSGEDPERAAFKDVEDICIQESGVGFVADSDPEYVAAANESLLIEAQCMQDLGWSDFPNPVPGEGDRLVSGLSLARAIGTFAPPIDPEAKERYESDREYCGTQSGRPYYRE